MHLPTGSMRFLFLLPLTAFVIGYVVSRNALASGVCATICLAIAIWIVADRKKKELTDTDSETELPGPAFPGKVNHQEIVESAYVVLSSLEDLSHLSKTIPPDQLFMTIQNWVHSLEHRVRSHSGNLLPTAAGSVMASWDSAEQAILTALEFRTVIATLNTEMTAQGFSPLRMTSGIGKGSIILGYLNQGTEVVHSAFGTAVSQAISLQSLAKDLQTDMLVTKSILDESATTFIIDRPETAPESLKDEVCKIKGYVAKDGKKLYIQTPWENQTPDLFEDEFGKSPHEGTGTDLNMGSSHPMDRESPDPTEITVDVDVSEYIEHTASRLMEARGQESTGTTSVTASRDEDVA